MEKIEKQVDEFEKRGSPNTLEVTPYGQDPKWVREQDPFLVTIERLSRIPDFDPVKLQQIMDMQEKALDRNAKQLFNISMVDVQKNIPEVPKDKTNSGTKPPSKYSSYEMIMRHCKPVYTKEGFAVSTYEGTQSSKDDNFPPIPDGEVRIFADVLHEGGWSKTYYVDMPLDDKGPQGTKNKTLPHAKKSSLSYGRSALMCMILNIPTGDGDDGNAAGGGQIEYINDQQFSSLVDMMNEVKANQAKFFKFFKIKKLDELPAKRFQEAWDMLEKKKT